MSKARTTAAGAVVLRGSGPRRAVALVHRPAYDDWCLPKGKPDPDEDLPVTAVREVYEESGLQVRLATPLGTVRYPVAEGTKTVHWWLGIQRGGELRTGGTTPRKNGTQEVDEARWVRVDEARELLTHRDEAEVLERALAVEPGALVVLVRHAKAMQRKHWSGKDAKRPLSGRGRRQAQRLVALLSAYGVDVLESSSSTRCVQTLAPYAKRQGLEVVRHDELSEEAFEDDEAASTEAMRALVRRALEAPDTPRAVCGHRPLLPMMRDQLGLAPAAMLVAEAAIVHHDAHGQLTHVETLKSAF